MAGKSGAPWWAHVMLYAGGLTMVVAGGAAAMGQYGLVKANNTLETEDILGEDRAEIDAENIEGPLNFLVLGIDEQGGGKRSDTTMMVHVNEDLTEATLISVPRDLWVEIPDCGPGWGGGSCEFKLNHASSLEDWGDSLANINQTLYDLTGVRFHGAATANFEGFIDLVDVVGEIELCPWHEITSDHGEHRTFPEGCAYYDKDEALDLVRQRKGWNWDSDWESGRGGDYGRTLMQQQAIKSILVEAKRQGFHTDLTKTSELLDGFGKNLTVDLGVDVLDLIVAMRDVDPENFASVNVPASSETIVYEGEDLSIDRIHEGEEQEAADALWTAIQDDTLDEWIAAHPEWVKSED